MQIKSMIVEKMDEAGTGLARIATLSAVDHDGDTYQRGAFSWKEGGNQWCSILPAHDRRALPLGKARVYEEGDTVFAELKLNLETQPGREWHAALKFDLANAPAVVEWSYGFDTLEIDYEYREGKQVRLLKKLDVHEVSPVLRGAGVGTGTVGIKDAQLKDDQLVATLAGLSALTAAVTANPAMLSATGIKQLGEIHVGIAQVLSAAKGKDDDGDQLAGDLALGAFTRFLVRGNLPPA